MTPEEQLAYWSSANIDLATRLERIETLQMQTLHQVRAGDDQILFRTSSMIMDLRADLSSTSRELPSGEHIWRGAPATARIDVPMLLWVHRLISATSTLPETLRGTLRTMVVTIESLAPESSAFSPLPPEDLPEALSAWCDSWRGGYDTLLSKDDETKLDSITQAYYDFLRIHPFMDGNGRVARVLLDQMLRELLGVSLPSSFMAARVEHQVALQKANAGDLAPLRALIVAALS